MIRKISGVIFVNRADFGCQIASVMPLRTLDDPRGSS